MRSCSSSALGSCSPVGRLLEAAMRSSSSALGGVLGRADLVADALELLARLVDLLLGLFGAVAAGLRLAAGLLERDGKVGGGLLEVLDALQRGQQARDDGGGVVEVGDRVALDAGIGIEALLALDVLGGARGLAGGERLLDPRRRLASGGTRRACRPCASRPTAAARARAPGASRAPRPGAAGACASASGCAAARRRGPRGRARSRSPRRA